MQRAPFIILLVLALLGIGTLATASVMWTSTNSNPAVALTFNDPNTGKNIVQKFSGTGANFLVMNQDPERDLYVTMSARNSNGLNIMAEAIGMGILLTSGSNSAVLSWQDNLNPTVFEFPNGLSMTPKALIITGSFKLNSSNTATGKFNLDVSGTLDYFGTPVPARMTAVFSPGPMTAAMSPYSTIHRGFKPFSTVSLPPVATSKNISIAFGTTTQIDLLAGAQSFQTNQALSPTILSQPSNGTLSPITNGKVTFTPSANFAGTDVFTFIVTDVAGNTSAQQLVTITVTGKPNATPILLKVEKNTVSPGAPIDFSPLNLGANFISGVTNGANGTVQQSGNRFFYIPNPGFTGFDTLTYTISNSNGFSATGEVDVEVTPIAVNDFAAVTNTVGATVTIPVLANDIDINNPVSLTILAVSNGANGTTAISGGSIIYTVTNPITSGGEDHFLYLIQDKQGNMSAGVVTVRPTP